MADPTDPDHDGAYKTLFRQRELVQQFIHHFVPASVVSQLDLSRMELVNTSFVLERLRRDSDCIWKLHFNNGEPLYLFMLVEFQSTVYTYMAVRVALYIALLYDYLITTQAKELDGKLPPTISFVIYNGQPTWSANRELANFYPISQKTGLQEYQLHHQYILLDLGRFTDKDLPPNPDIISTLFQMEKASLNNHFHLLPNLFDRLVELTSGHHSHLAIQQALLTFFEDILRQRGAISPGQNLSDFNQVKTMLHNFDTAVEQIRQQERLQGLQEGKKQAVLSLLSHQFQADMDKWGQRLEGMTLQQLDDLFSRILKASSESELDQ